MDLALKSAADFMEDRKHILDRWKETFNQSPALLFLGKVYRGEKVSKQFNVFLSVSTESCICLKLLC